jgi:hypothetical protein
LAAAQDLLCRILSRLRRQVKAARYLSASPELQDEFLPR